MEKIEKKYDIWMKFYVSDYVGDTMQLGPEEHGIYLLLILYYWKKQGPITDDLSYLKRISRVESTELLEEILKEYFTHNDGKWHHKRIEKELLDAKERSEHGKKGAEGRWGNKDKNDARAMPEQCPTVCPSDAQSMLYQSQSQSQSYNQNSESESKPSKKMKNKMVKEEFELFYAAYPKKKDVDSAEKAFIKHYKEMPPVDELVEIVNKNKLTESWKKDNGQYIPLPSTWLNKKRWKDDISSSQQSNYKYGGSINFEL